MVCTVVPVFFGVDFERGRLFSTTDLDEVRLLSGEVLSPHKISVVGTGRKLNSHMDRLALGPLSLMRLTWGASVEVDPGHLDTYYLISMPVKGHASFCLDGQSVDVSPRRAVVVNPTQRFHFTTSDDFEQIVVRIERAAFETGWQALTGEPAAMPINFEPAIPTDGVAWRALDPMLQLLARSAKAGDDSASARLLNARLQEMLVSTLLLQQPHAGMTTLMPPPQPALPVYVRRAEIYMGERLCEPLTVSDVALACGVSIRTLQSAFHSAYGCGPMQWLRERRLHRIREALHGDESPRQSVTDTALRFGFTHIGEFSKAYRRMFGETAGRSLVRRNPANWL